MKKNNTYLADDEIDLGNLIKSLWREKILILSISIICGLAGYLYASFQPQEFRTEFKLKNPPIQIFEPYIVSNIKNNNKNNDNININNNIAEQFISDFELDFLSLDNLRNFIEESREFDNFKRYLKSKNISVKQYFSGLKLSQVKEKGIIIPNKYFLNHSKELDGSIFINKYVEFINKKTIVEFKHVMKLSILNTINNHQEALEIAKKIQLENPIIKTTSQQQVVIEPEALFYKGTKVLEENIINLNKKMMKLENDQFVFNIMSQKPMTLPNDTKSLTLYFALGLMLGLFLSLVIIFFKGILKNN
jgi:LPS O-antigen subunit length determinant protein (WzzB/FepE family)